jgi:1-acyl-sn-glycerol-3-phosphate acyltransferase
VLWGYFTVGYLIFFSPFSIWALCFAKKREQAFQVLLHRYCHSFIKLVDFLFPQTRFDISDAVGAIRSAVIVSNHLSYLDPLLLVALFAQQKTIVKKSFFKVPIFGWILKLAGYIPANFNGLFSDYLMEHADTLRRYLENGGNIFIFPEGTRSRDGIIGPFKKGAFKIANVCQIPIKVVVIKNTQRLFKPGRFLFRTGVRNTITVDLIGHMEPSQSSQPSALIKQMHQAREMMVAAMGPGRHKFGGE